MRRKCASVAAWAATGLLMSLSLPAPAPAALLTGDVTISGTGGDPPPPPPPSPHYLGVLWTDDFEDGGTEGWVVGLQTSPLPPLNVPDGGPAGAGDNFLRLRANGDPNLAGGRFVVLNRNGLWRQDLHDRGVTRIEMDFVNRGFSPLHLRLAAYTLGPNGFASTDAVVVPPDGQWHHLVFPFTARSMTQLGSMTFEKVLDHFEEVRILHSAVPSLRGDPVVADGGVDNIQVIATPEPSSAALAGAALSWALLRRRRRH